jgi:pyruvate/2-oxoglutarate dehydrogenase complex dihydrolipoamide acyltransferase (E2) component
VHQAMSLRKLRPVRLLVAGYYYNDNKIYSCPDKAAMAFECQDDWIIAKILVPGGSEVKVGAPVLITVDSADAVAAFADYKAPAAATVTTAPPATQAAAAPTAPVPTAPTPAKSPALPPASAEPSPPTPKPAVQNFGETSMPPSTSGVYSVRHGGVPKKTPLSNKFNADRKAYIEKYGRCGHAITVKSK